MKAISCVFLLLLVSPNVAAGNAVSFDWVTVGNPGNADDEPNGFGNAFGSVNEIFRISKYEVTNAQYVEFLNAVAKTDTNGLYSISMDSDTLGGITRSGSSGGYAYSVKTDAIGEGPGGADGNDYSYSNKPVVFVSFFDAMRFVNWLENGQPVGTQGPETTENGVYSISDGLSEVRDSNATYFIPSEDEWYKAAYYDPSGTYYDYPTSADSVPDNNLPSADTGNSANYRVELNFTTGSFTHPMTDVGSYSMSESSYGTYDQAGNVWEWNDTINAVSSFRGVRGGAWNTRFSKSLRADGSGSNQSHIENGAVGFRVASRIPEPGSFLLALIAVVGLMMRARFT